MLSYVVPLRRWSVGPIDELAKYVNSLAETAQFDVIVVDGSDSQIFSHHARRFTPSVRHLPVERRFSGLSGKVNGVLTGIEAAHHERVVIADDDVRYDEATLQHVAGLLADAHVVRPQNYFSPLPWHARWDTARSLLNRSVAADFPGTLAVRRSALRRTGGYDANVLFENLELMRTIEAAGGIVADAPDTYVRRLPPTTKQFLRQRVRQAYDSRATPARMFAELSLLPLIGLALRRRWWWGGLAALAGAITAAELGRRRHGGQRVFSASCSLFAPLWLLERAVCAWCALALCLFRGGVGYAGTRFRRAATPSRVLRRRFRHLNLEQEALLV